MNKIVLLYIGCLLTTMVVAQPITIDQTNASISFLFLDDDVDGTLSGFKFTGSLDFNALETSTISGTVASKTIDTDNWLRNRHLRNKYFKTDDFPTISFKSTSISASEGFYRVNGTLTIKGINKKVSFKFKKATNKLIGTATINAAHFDIYIHDEAARNKVSFKILLPYSE